jgi:hypothetical protein
MLIKLYFFFVCGVYILLITAWLCILGKHMPATLVFDKLQPVVDSLASFITIVLLVKTKG